MVTVCSSPCFQITKASMAGCRDMCHDTHGWKVNANSQQQGYRAAVVAAVVPRACMPHCIGCVCAFAGWRWVRCGGRRSCSVSIAHSRVAERRSKEQRGVQLRCKRLKALLLKACATESAHIEGKCECVQQWCQLEAVCAVEPMKRTATSVQHRQTCSTLEEQRIRHACSQHGRQSIGLSSYCETLIGLPVSGVRHVPHRCCRAACR
jgi:hypothetical protein